MLAVRQETELLFSIYDAKKNEVIRCVTNTVLHIYELWEYLVVYICVMCIYRCKVLLYV